MTSQTISKPEPRVQTLINSKGDTMIQMNLADAKIILNDLFDKQVSDSLVDIYSVRDSLNMVKVNLLKSEVDTYKEKCGNYSIMISNFTKLIVNKDTEISLLNQIIKDQKKEIRKQKILKILGFTAAVVLPITTLLILHH